MAKPSPPWRKVVAWWTIKTGIDWQNYKLIFKDTLPPAITLAANQATAWSNIFGSLGYLVPIVSIISHPAPPRAEFLWILITNILGSCVSAAVTALAMFCVIKGREQSGGGRPSEGAPVPYNAVASTVAAIWLIVQVYVTSAIRYKYPWTIWMTSACLIFSNYGMVYATQFPNMPVAFRFLRQLLFAHLVAFGISAGVSLCVFPTNCRQSFFRTVLACTDGMRAILKSDFALMEHASSSTETPASSERDVARKQHKESLDSLQAKLLAQVDHAKNEVAWGRLHPADLHTLTRLLADIVIPLGGLCQVPDVVDRVINDEGKWKGVICCSAQYRELLGSVIQPFSEACAAAEEGLECSKALSGIDSSACVMNIARLDEKTSIQSLQRAMDALIESKSTLLDAWRAQHGKSETKLDAFEYDQSRSDLHMLLYTELLLWSICRKVQQLLFWIAQLKVSKRLKRRRLILPEWTNFKTTTNVSHLWRKTKDRRSSRNTDPGEGSVGMFNDFCVVCLKLYQECTRFFASPASGFGLRVTCATMSVAVVAFLPSTQAFYINQHVVWAQYTISFAILGSAGQGVRALCLRMGGTVIAACLAWISWYIVIGIPAGVLVFYWLSLHFPMYIMALRPRFYTVGTVTGFTLTTILGNALQPNGSGQSTIVLGAIRLLAIAGGCFLATLWTLFPYPMSDLDGARNSLADCFASLANYHTSFHDIVRARLEEGFTHDKESPPSRSRELEDVHARFFVKCTSHLHSLRAQLRLAKWNIHLDGVSFSRTYYEQASKKVDDLARNMQLMSFASEIFVDFINSRPDPPLNRMSGWHVEFRNLFDAAQNEGFGPAALLSLLAYAVRNETSLPPRLAPPNPAGIRKMLNEPEGLAEQITQIDDPGAATFALIRIGMNGLYSDLEQLFEIVKSMVGEGEGIGGSSLDEERL